MKYEVQHAMHSNGPKFATIKDALAYIRHCLKNGNTQMTIIKL